MKRIKYKLLIILKVRHGSISVMCFHLVREFTRIFNGIIFFEKGNMLSIQVYISPEMSDMSTEQGDTNFSSYIQVFMDA